MDKTKRERLRDRILQNRTGAISKTEALELLDDLDTMELAIQGLAKREEKAND